MRLHINIVSPQSDLDQVFALECASYPADEAATMEKLQLRAVQAANYFVVARFEGDERIVGFVNGTLANGDSLNHESMSQHVDGGNVLCIHSVVIDEQYRRRGLGVELVKKYLEHIKKIGHPLVILLICKENLIEFYKSAGFELIGKSHVEHGQDQWFEMKHTYTKE